MDEWLRDVNERLVFVSLLVLLLLAAEAGFRIARRVHAGHQSSSEVVSIQGAVLGLLALLLGFTFSLAMSRFEARKELIRDEANVIGTAYLRTQLLPEPARQKVATTMQQYLETRFELQRDGFDPVRLHAIHVRSSKLQHAMWTEAVAAANAAPDSEMMSLVISSLNELIDTHGLQVAAIRNRVPVPIFLLLFCVAIAALGLCGYASGPSHRQSGSLTVVVAVLIAAVIMLIFDLHRPARGLVKVEVAALNDLRESIKP